ncbi:uncharacterized protein ACA1_093670, partial [Acanthamoeba castellanii str. Neff]
MLANPTPSSIIVAISAIAALQQQLGWQSILSDPAFPHTQVVVKRMQKKVRKHKIDKEETKPPELMDSEIDTTFHNLLSTPASIQSKLYLILLWFLNHHSSKTIKKTVGEVVINKEQQWVEIHQGTYKKNVSTKSKADPLA